MNKLELISELSKKLDIKKDKVEDFFSCLNQTISENLKKQKKDNPNTKIIKVIIGDLGAVHLKHKKERVCKVPNIDKTVTIPAKDVPAFKISKKFMNLFTE